MNEEEELLEYITCCVIYKHQYDKSYRITDSATEKENELFESALRYLMQLDKNRKVFDEQYRKDHNCDV